MPTTSSTRLPTCWARTSCRSTVLPASITSRWAASSKALFRLASSSTFPVSTNSPHSSSHSSQNWYRLWRTANSSISTLSTLLSLTSTTLIPPPASYSHRCRSTLNPIISPKLFFKLSEYSHSPNPPSFICFTLTSFSMPIFNHPTIFLISSSINLSCL